MKKNMGNLDRLIRVIAAVVIAILYYMNVIGGTTAIILLVVAAVFILTSAIGSCPLYSVFGFSSQRSKQ